MSAPRVFGRYDAAAIGALFASADVPAAVAARGFTDLETVIDGTTQPHVRLLATKNGTRFALLDAILAEATVSPASFAAFGYEVANPIELAVVYWLREEDPTASFDPARPRLPLQRHPGLGILRRAFRVIVRMALDLGKDGVVCVPKFFHDAVIFQRSRLFLFLDPDEQGRFEALIRDLAPLPLGDESLALLSGGVRDQHGAVVTWAPGFQVCPLSPALTSWFNHPSYAARVAAAAVASRFTTDAEAIVRARASIASFA